MTRVLRLGINDRYAPRFYMGFKLADGICARNCMQPALQVLTSKLGTLKGGRADWLIEKYTELGACSVTPLLTERCHTIAENRVDRLQRLVLAAVKRCQRIHEMSLKPPIQIGNLLPVVSESNLAFLASAEAPPRLSALPKSSKEQSGPLIIGPEGDNKI